jgi:hypothetical protein
MGALSKRPKYSLLYLFVISLAVPYASACIEISEVHAHDPEWVEIYNPCGTEIDLSGWSISDSRTPDEITCHTSPECTLQTNSSYFIIIDRTTNITDVAGDLLHFFVDDNSIGSGLNNDGDTINISNGSYSNVMSYPPLSTGKSWSLCNSSWTETENVTPGYDNYCEENLPPEDNNETNDTDETGDLGDLSLVVHNPSGSHRFGDFANVRADLYAGNAEGPVIISSYIYSPRWITNDLEGNTIRINPNETSASLAFEVGSGQNTTLLLPLILKSNCDGDYQNGMYTGFVKVYEDATGEVVEQERFNITLSGNNPTLCQDCPPCGTTNCKKSSCSCPPCGISTSSIEGELELIELVSFEEVVQAGVPFETKVRVENTEERRLMFSIYSYAWSGKTRGPLTSRRSSCILPSPRI